MNPSSIQLDRRAVLRTLTGGAVVATLGHSLRPLRATEPSLSRPTSLHEFRTQMRGPILSIPTPFLASQEIDFKGVSRMIDRAIPHQIRIFSLTSGNSQYDSLTYDEILKLTTAMIESVNGRGLTIASTDDWDIVETVKYAQFAESAGADAVQVMQPDADDDQVVGFFRKVADATRLPIVLHGNFSTPLLERLVEIDSIVALKQDVSLEYYIEVQRKFGDRLAIFEGGPEYAFLVAFPYGSPASYTTLGTFVPQVTQQFWNAIERDDVETAYNIVNKYEHPFFDRWSHAFWRASLEHFGVAARYLRSPNPSFSDEQMKGVAEFYNSLGLS